MDCRQKSGYGKIQTDGTIRHEAGLKVHSMDVLHQEKKQEEICHGSLCK